MGAEAARLYGGLRHKVVPLHGLPAKRADVTFRLRAWRHPNVSWARIEDRSGITQLGTARGPFTVLVRQDDCRLFEAAALGWNVERGIGQGQDNLTAGAVGRSACAVEYWERKPCRTRLQRRPGWPTVL
jgi:hypothetical protein